MTTRRRTVIRGVAKSVGNSMGDIMNEIIRVQVLDERGDVIENVPVQVYGVPLGSVSNGDEVEVVGRYGSDGVVRPRILRNLTTGSNVEGPVAVKWFVGCTFAFVIVGFVVFAIILGRVIFEDLFR